MTRLEIMQANKTAYAELRSRIKYMRGLEKAVAETLVTEWLTSNNFLGGISDRKYNALSAKLERLGYDETEISDEFDRQIMEIGASME